MKPAARVMYTLSLHDALPISAQALAEADLCAGDGRQVAEREEDRSDGQRRDGDHEGSSSDRKSTRLNSSHANSSYAVVGLKKTTGAGRERTTSAGPRQCGPTC